MRDALIKGSSPICDIFCMLALCSHCISSHSICPWFTRVASESNPGDDPSRGKSLQLLSAQHESPLQMSESLVSPILSVESFFDFMEESSRSQ